MVDMTNSTRSLEEKEDNVYSIYNYSDLEKGMMLAGHDFKLTEKEKLSKSNLSSRNKKKIVKNSKRKNRK